MDMINIFKWKYDRRSGNCNLSNYKLTRKNFFFSYGGNWKYSDVTFEIDFN